MWARSASPPTAVWARVGGRPKCAVAALRSKSAIAEPSVFAPGHVRPRSAVPNQIPSDALNMVKSHEPARCFDDAGWHDFSATECRKSCEQFGVNWLKFHK